MLIFSLLLIACDSSVDNTETTIDETELDWSQWNRISNPFDVEHYRQIAISEWLGQWPTRMPDLVESISDPIWPGYQIDRIEVMTDGHLSVAYLLHPISSNGKLVIYHQGHKGDFRIYGKETIDRLLESNLTVLALAMPELGMNGSGSGTAAHIDLPLHIFILPVIVSLNWVESVLAPQSTAMIGISGGGWTTALVSALDSRITASYPISGVYPELLRQLDPNSYGDYEQRLVSNLYPETPGYLELFLLASTGRRQVQVFNEMDPCCFSGRSPELYLEYINSLMLQLTGSFDIWFFTEEGVHGIPTYIVDEIILDF